VRNLDPELVALPHGLSGNSERGEDEDVAAGVVDDLPRPFKLHRGLTEPAFGEDR
jgi:hypothetical protein